MSKAKITILGCGPSMGVPVIGCACRVCVSSNAKNNRTRTSLLYTTAKGDNIVFDTTPEFRIQMLRAKVSCVEHVVFTHTHADHCHGFDDLRGLYFNQKRPIHCHLAAEHREELIHKFSYSFQSTGYQGSKPQINLETVAGPFQAAGVELEPITVAHGGPSVTAFRVGTFAYLTDFKELSPAQISGWRGKVKVMVASALQKNSHPTHSSVSETVALMAALGVERGILTHLSHSLDYDELAAELPKNIVPAYDGLVIDVP